MHRVITVGRAVAAVLAAGLITSGCTSDPRLEPAGHRSGGTAAPGGATSAQAPHPSPARSTLAPWAKQGMAKEDPLVAPARVGEVSEVAQAIVPAVPVYRTVDDDTPLMTLVNPLPSKAPRVFLVQERRPGRLRVLLPVRPNQSQGWIRESDVKLSQHDYRMVVSVGRHALTVYRGSSVVMQESVGLGTGSTPTPGGVYYTKELLRPPNPTGAYGPYAYGLSGYSPVLNEFLGGDGTLGIHGTNDPSGIGKNVSHGCIRVRNAAITRLAGMLPLGVPVEIVR